MDTPETPDVSDGDVAVPSNIINGVFGDNQATAQELEQMSQVINELQIIPPDMWEKA